MDYAWVDNKVSSGTVWQVGKEKKSGPVVPICWTDGVCSDDYHLFNPDDTRWCFYRKSSFSGHSCSFQFHTFTHIHTHARGSACTSYIFSSMSLWLRAHTEPCDTWYQPLGCCMYFLWKRRALEALSFVKCVSESRTEKTPSLRSDVWWFDNIRTAPGLMEMSFVETAITHWRPRQILNTASGLKGTF